MAKRRELRARWWIGCAAAIGTGPLFAQPLTVVPPQSVAAPPQGAGGHVTILPPFQISAPAIPAVEAEGELSVDGVVQRVLARNPSITQMTEAWKAAAARYPQVHALDDPMITGIVGPASIGSRDVDFAYRVEMSQRIPYPGKRQLRGESALAQAAAAGSDVEAVRQQLIEAARSAVYDYYLAARNLEVNHEGLLLLRDFRQNAEARYRTGQAPQQDVLRADVEIARQRERTLALERARKVATARINTLMHLPPDAALPPPPKELKVEARLPEAKVLRDLAQSRRPELQAAQHRIEAEQAAVRLAWREYKPDFEVMAAYDAFWQPRERDLRTMIGLRLNLPVQRDRRAAAVAEAEARVAERVAGLHRLIDQVNYEVQAAIEMLNESEQAIRLYEATILPAARASVKSAQSAYVNGKVPFLTLIEAQRGLVDLRDRFYEASVESLRRRAALERVLGNPIPAPPQ